MIAKLLGHHKYTSSNIYIQEVGSLAGVLDKKIKTLPLPHKAVDLAMDREPCSFICLLNSGVPTSSVMNYLIFDLLSTAMFQNKEFIASWAP